jgi:Leucine-rich repeat (LRR) protein
LVDPDIKGVEKMKKLAELNNLLDNPHSLNHMRVLMLVDQERCPKLLAHAVQRLQEWKLSDYGNSALEDMNRYSSPLVRKLFCGNEELEELPDNLQNVVYLRCENNPLTTLPNNLHNLQELYCWNTKLRNLPDNLNNLRKLNCRNTKVTNLPNNLKAEELQTLVW